MLNSKSERSEIMADNKQTSFADSTTWRVISFTGHAITLNLLFLASCLPVIVFAVLKVAFNNLIFNILFFLSFLCVGPALSGLFSAIRFFLRKDEWFAGFKAGYKTNPVQMMIVSVLGSAAILYMGDIVYAMAKNYNSKLLASLIPNALILAIALGFTTAAVVYNVFFPRRFIDLLTETAAFVFKAPLQLVITGALLWAPIFATLVYSKYILPFLIVFLAVYFSLAAMIGIGLLKDPLIKVLTKKRESGELPPLKRNDSEEE